MLARDSYPIELLQDASETLNNDIRQQDRVRLETPIDKSRASGYQWNHIGSEWYATKKD